MQLPQDDERYLNENGFDWSLEDDGQQSGFLLIRNFDVTGGGFTPPTTDLMIRIPAQYNMAKLDMWYCSPRIQFAETGQIPATANVVEQYLGREWQRFSRHLTQWRPGVDNLRTFMVFIYRELQGKQ